MARHYSTKDFFRQIPNALLACYSRNGREYRETADTTDERQARKYLQRRVEEIKKPEFVGPSEKRLVLDDLKIGNGARH